MSGFNILQHLLLPQRLLDVGCELAADGIRGWLLAGVEVRVRFRYGNRFTQKRSNFGIA